MADRIAPVARLPLELLTQVVQQAAPTPRELSKGRVVGYLARRFAADGTPRL